MKKPIIKAVRQAAQSRIFNIEAIDLEFSNGAQRTYERIQTPMDAVIVIPFISPDEFILVREYSAATETYELTLPKGAIDPGEEPMETANRELREEIGYRAESLRYIRPLNIAPGYIRHITHVIAASDLAMDPLDGDEPEPLEQSTWHFDALDDLLNNHELTDARTIAALLLLTREPFQHD